jgi:MFS family permease
MPRRDDRRDRRPGRFSSSGHTEHRPTRAARGFEVPPLQAPPMPQAPPPPAPQALPMPQAPPAANPAEDFSRPTYHHIRPSNQTEALPMLPPAEALTQQLPSDPARPQGSHYTAAYPSDGYSPTTEPADAPPPGYPPPAALPPGTVPAPSSPQSISVTKVMFHRTKYLSIVVKDRVRSASEADGARESGLTALLWNQVMAQAADAMITVALAGTIFFAATGDAQRGNVLQYLLITMAPFALVAPIIGPTLDRLQHGRRYAMAGTAIGRALLALVMASHFTNYLVLLPAALGSLVLSKAYAVVRGSAAPRLVPNDMTLVTANSRLSIFGLGATALGGGFLATFLKLTGSYQWGLRIAAIAFAATAFYAIKLPRSVDSEVPAPRHPGEPNRPQRTTKVPSSVRLREWASRGFGQEVLTSLQASGSLRGMAGFLTLFLAFYIQQTASGFDAVFDLALFALAAGGGSFVGTAAGARLRLGRPEATILICALAAAASCIVTVVLFGTTLAIICSAIVGAANALAKLSLDAVIQRDVVESLRSSAFGRSETFLQLAWVFGAALAVILPAGRGRTDLSVATVILTLVVTAIALHDRAVKRSPSH